MNETQVKTMQYCNNYFAALCERVTGAHVSDAAITADFKGRYREGMLLRVHGSYNVALGGFNSGECYEVVSFDSGVLTLDRALYTNAPNLFIVTCEPTGEFVSLCDDIAAYEAKAAGREGLASESIDGYSWSAAQTGTGFASVFADRLAQFKLAAPTPLYYARWAAQWR